MQPESVVHEQEYLLAQLEALAVARVAPPSQGLFLQFLRRYYEMAAVDALRQQTPAQLVETAFAHWQFAARREAGIALVEVVQPPPDRPGTLAMLRTCVEDMPFLVDSVSMAVREAGSSIDWAVHPVLRIRRSADGVLEQVFAPSADEAAPESLIHLEFEPLADAGAYAVLEERLRRVFADLRIVVADFEPMRTRVTGLIEQLHEVPAGADPDDYAEARAFLAWLRDEHFTFLGYAETRAEPGPAGRPHFLLVPEQALGLARPGGPLADPDALIAPKQELDRYAESSQLVVVIKANARAPVRHPEYMDVVSVKRFRGDGTLMGTSRFLGLLSIEAYFERPRNIPLIRRKVAYVMKRSRLPEQSHGGKLLRAILQQLPRDDLFQIDDDELYQICMGIRALRDRHQLRLFMRRDRYGRFYSFLVFLPREKYSRELRDRVGQELLELCNGLSMERSVEFPRGFPARIHIIVRTPPGTRLPLSAAEIEHRLIVATRSWRDLLRELLPSVAGAGAGASQLLLRYGDAFPVAYTETKSALEAAADILYLSRLSAETPMLPRLQLDEAGQPNVLKLYTWGRPVELSAVMPTLENFGLRVIRQEPTEVRPKDGPVLWLQEFAIRAHAADGQPPDTLRSLFEHALLQAWRGETENDGLNRLVLGAGLDSRQVSGLRLLTRYLLQTGLPFSQAYIEALLAEHAPLARLLLRLFETRFDPRLADERRHLDEIALGQAIDAALDQVASLDGDRVLRAFLAVIRAGLRSNYFQHRPDGTVKPWISLKLDPAKVPELPAPRPMFEVFVYAPEVEGVHLRGGKVARGGLRWSDRRQDFRTEVLGLMKAQRVKNAIIVPVGAKGGFVLKSGDAAQREAYQQLGIAAYQTFVRGLLDVTDNLVAGQVQAPRDVVRHDGDDPYLVVAADKGTASFSDIANGLAAEYGFWLGDAFASGGSAGYDHKKMGITARGAWESVKRHFRELGRDIQAEDFTVVGIGDMSGDVFGNGMLLSRHIRLIAAFDHRHIFVDPDPDAETSFAERERLFALPRSSWADYDAKRLSPGGGIWPRTQKSIALSEAAQLALGARKATLTPQELVSTILRAPVDLLWNGGIGTYVKAQTQSHIEVGDRANDGVRVNGRELRAKVVGEGGNLGFTQLGRIEYALAGGRLNTDAIDNAGGVHSSDREVNIKIPLNQLLREGQLTREARDPVLASLTEHVAAAVLRDNFVQSQAVSLVEQHAAARLEEHAALIRGLERDGLLDRAVEFLPDDEALKERRRDGRGLTRPEIAVLLAYAKISLFEATLGSRVPDDPAFERELIGYFPAPLIERYRDAYAAHPLRREIVATALSNEVINRMDLSFAHQLSENHGVTRSEAVRAYAAAARIYGADQYWAAIEALDFRPGMAVQYNLCDRVAGLLRHASAWLADRELRQPETVAAVVERFAAPVAEIETLLPEGLPPTYREEWQRAVDGLRQSGVPEPLAARIGHLRVLGSALDIAELATEATTPLPETTAVYFETGERFRMPWLHSAIVGLKPGSKWQALARTQLREDAYRAQRALAARVLRQPAAAPAARAKQWLETNALRVRPVLARLQELHANGVPDLAGLSVAVRQIGELAAMAA